MQSLTMTPVARKTHLCDLCGTTINAGEKYVNQRVFGDGQAWTNKYHLDPCEAALKEYANTGRTDYDGTVPHEWIQEWATDHRGLYDTAAALHERMNRIE